MTIYKRGVYQQGLCGQNTEELIGVAARLKHPDARIKALYSVSDLNCMLTDVERELGIRRSLRTDMDRMTSGQRSSLLRQADQALLHGLSRIEGAGVLASPHTIMQLFAEEEQTAIRQQVTPDDETVVETDFIHDIVLLRDGKGNHRWVNRFTGEIVGEDKGVPTSPPKRPRFKHAKTNRFKEITWRANDREVPLKSFKDEDYE